jgi:hypothetical protein
VGGGHVARSGLSEPVLGLLGGAFLGRGGAGSSPRPRDLMALSELFSSFSLTPTSCC